jgi:LmbE family N-acetylglucosaminyl deacetylase
MRRVNPRPQQSLRGIWGVMFRSGQFLEALRSRARGLVDARHLAVITAHPDDEAVGCGALLPRLSGITNITVTDGAPRDLIDARACGFTSAEDYAAARKAELRKALAIADVSSANSIQLDLVDQQVAFNLTAVALRLSEIFRTRDTRLVLTHAIEGGHPDHDGVALAVRAAAAHCARAGHIMPIVEMPYYRAGMHGVVHQTFVPPAGRQIKLRLEPWEQERKRDMFAAHTSQTAVLAPFSVTEEKYRVAAPFDFRTLPNGSHLLYDRYPSGLNGERWLARAAATLRDLDLAPVCKNCIASCSTS